MYETPRPLTLLLAHHACVLRAALTPVFLGAHCKSQSTVEVMAWQLPACVSSLKTLVLACTLKTMKEWPACNLPLLVK